MSDIGFTLEQVEIPNTAGMLKWCKVYPDGEKVRASEGEIALWKALVAAKEEVEEWHELSQK